MRQVLIRHGEESHEVKAKIDTGAYRTSIDETLANQIGLKTSDKQIFIQSASGESYRPTVNLTLDLKGKKINTTATTIDRSKLRYPMIIGRRDLRGFLVKPEIEGDVEETSDES